MFKNIIILGISLIVINSYSQVNHLETYYDRQGGIEGLKYPKDIEFDSYGNIYIVGNSTLTHLFMLDSLNIFSYIEKHDANKYPGLINVDEIESTFDKKFYYITGDNELFVFSKIDSSYRLSLRQSIKNSDSIIVGYAGPTNIVVTPDSKNLYLSVYDKYVINIFTIDSLTGELTFKSKISNIKNINDIIFSNKFVYTTSAGYPNSSICVFQRTDNLDSLKLIKKLSTNDSIIDPSCPVLSMDNKYLYIHDNKTIAIFNVDEVTGKISFKQRLYIEDFYDNFYYGIDMLLSSDNKYLYLADSYGLLVFERDSITGDLTFIQSIQENNNFTGFDGISSIKFSESSSELFVLSEYNNSIIIFKRNYLNGELTYYNKVVDEQGKINGLSDAVDILISNNDKHLYTLANAGTNSIALFERKSDGYLKFIKNVTWDELGPEIGATWSFELNPNDQYMYISSTNMYGIRILSRDTVTGNLKFYKSYTNAGTGITDNIISDIVITKDSKNLYAGTSQYLVNYRINSDSSDLTYNSKILIDEIGNGGLIGNQSIISSHDGKNLYTYSYSNFYPNGIAVYSRSENGNITHLENYTSKNYLFKEGAFSILISPDDNFLYVVGTSIFCFKRNSEDGRLVFYYEIKYEDIKIEGLSIINRISLSSDGKYLIGISDEKKIILSFYRNSSNGKLILKQIKHFSDDNNYGPISAKPIFSRDMKNAYIISRLDRSLSAFKANIPIGLTEINNVCGDSIELFVDKGYNYLWSTGDTSSYIKIVNPGEYSVYVNDKTGREGWDTTLVDFHTVPLVKIFHDTVYSTTDTTFILSNITEGTYPYFYLWSDSSNLSSLFVDKTKLSNGEHLYSFTVSDKYGCVGSDSITLLVNHFNNIININENSSISIYPNPFEDYINIDLENSNNEIVSIKICNIAGEIIYSNKLEKFQTINLRGLKSGVYIIKFENETYYEQKIIIKH